MLINLSNHPFAKWEDDQRREAESRYGETVDLKFPDINPDADESEVRKIAMEQVDKCKALLDGAGDGPRAVHVVGEYTCAFTMINGLLDAGIECVASTTYRITSEENGEKKSIFRFVRFRRYER